jgi:flavin-dependent dehydrogenase
MAQETARGNALVGRPKEHVEVQAKVVVDGAGVELSQALELRARDVGAGVHEERRLPTALEGELAKLEHLALDHEVDELALVLLH